MAATLAAGLFFYSSCTPAEKTDTKDYTQYVAQTTGIHFPAHVILSV